MEKNHGKGEGKEQKPKKPPGFRKFKKLLKQVVKAKPLKNQINSHPAQKT